MKNLFKVALVAIAGVFGYNANAQMGFNIKGGLNVNSVTGKDVGDAKSNLGFHVGATYEIPVSSVVFVEAGILYDTRGCKFEEDLGPLGSKEVKTNFSTLTVPVLVKPRFEINDKIGVYGAVGPYMNYILGGKEGDIDVDFDKIPFKNMNRTQFGLSFGGGVEFASHFILGLSYDMGLTNIQKEVELPIVGKVQPKAKLNAFKISLGYKL